MWVVVSAVGVEVQALEGGGRGGEGARAQRQAACGRSGWWVVRGGGSEAGRALKVGSWGTEPAAG